MTTYTPTTACLHDNAPTDCGGARAHTATLGAVISPVVPRPSATVRGRRWLASTRPWREGTDPALRGRGGRRSAASRSQGGWV